MTDNEQIYDDDVILDEIEEAAAGDNNTGLYEHYRIVADAGPVSYTHLTLPTKHPV